MVNYKFKWKWEIANGNWKNGKWEMGNRKWEMRNGKCKIPNLIEILDKLIYEFKWDLFREA